MNKYIIIIGVIIGIMSTIVQAETLKPPSPPILPKTIKIHNDTIIDKYFGFRDRNNPKVLEYIKQENEYTDKVLAPTKPLQEKLYNEMLGRIKENDLSVPVKIDNYYYYTKTEQGKPYAIHCRKKDSLESKEEIILDENELAKGYNYFHLGVFKISPNHKILAYSVDTQGNENYTLYFKDLTTGKLLKDTLKNTYYSLEWTNDNKTVFYTIIDKANRPYKVYKHILGNTQSQDELIYHEKDEAFNISLSKSKSKKYIFINIDSSTTSEVHYIDADNLTKNVILPRKSKVEYSVEHHKDNFIILTNKNAKNFKIVSLPINNLSKKPKVIVQHNKDIKIDDIDVFKDYLIVLERQKGLKKIRVIEWNNNNSYYIEFDEPTYDIWQGPNKNYDSEIFRFTYTSLVTPISVYDFDLKTKQRELKKQYEVLGGYDPKNYVSERLYAKSYDGTMVPISLVYKKGIKKDGSNPLFLYGYGAYGVSTDPTFSSERLSLLDRGFIFAIAHIRGGEELGREWYQKGKLLNKKNSFYDFIACAEHLINEKYTSKDKTVIYGGSAGGLLMGAVTNMRPDLFKIVIAEVPFVDVINTMSDPSLPLTVNEYEEWGNPANKRYYNYMKSYSPYDNVKKQNYPNMLITGGFNDPRVSYWEPLKWTAKLRELKQDNNTLLLKLYMDTGHSGPSGRYETLKDIAFQYSFIFYILGIKE